MIRFNWIGLYIYRVICEHAKLTVVHSLLQLWFVTSNILLLLLAVAACRGFARRCNSRFQNWKVKRRSRRLRCGFSWNYQDCTLPSCITSALTQTNTDKTRKDSTDKISLHILCHRTGHSLRWNELIVTWTRLELNAARNSLATGYCPIPDKSLLQWLMLAGHRAQSRLSFMFHCKYCRILAASTLGNSQTCNLIWFEILSHFHADPTGNSCDLCAGTCCAGVILNYGPTRSYNKLNCLEKTGWFWSFSVNKWRLGTWEPECETNSKYCQSSAVVARCGAGRAEAGGRGGDKSRRAEGGGGSETCWPEWR